MRGSGGKYSPRLMPTNQRIRSIPAINQAVWAFSIGGRVTHPLSLSYADLLRQPSIALPVSVICTDHRSVDSANYTGVPLSALFDLVEIDPTAPLVVLHAYDGYSTLLKLDELREQAAIAYAIDDQPLTREQGYPARLVIPGRYGYKMPKWITRVEVTDREAGGTWESRGFDPDGKIGTVVEITRHEVLPHGAIRLRGFAYSPHTALDSLEVTVDGGLSTRFSLDASQPDWHVDWTPPYANGIFRFEVAVSAHQHGGVGLCKRHYTIRT